ncbi:hypothetical protein [Ferrimonas lipolytica]|uniref:Uncharacterized protein n=1 Tax=Ferrimonas lipolytica TaxID=2724191 RepID=A0A6H1UGV1_9GAMM|nr:hypothetical protein [Ferrimonas lipolytica]QIZ78335.1 hypothetical protein HER31_16375 [Ferrimonas lipolytica]
MRPFGVTPRCLISEPSVIDTAKASGRTRAIEAAHQAAERGLLEGALTHNGLQSTLYVVGMGDDGCLSLTSHAVNAVNCRCHSSLG